MKLIKYILVLIILLPVFSYGQSFNNKISLQKGIIYKKEFSIEAKLHTLGYAIGYNRGIISTYYLTKFYHFDIGYIKSIKEKKNNLVITGITVYNSYSYGKRNYFFPVRLGMGIKKYLSEKETHHGVAVGYSLEGGFTLGVLKPYFLVVRTRDQDNNTSYKTIKYSDENRHIFIDENSIFDRSSFFKGFDQLSMIPGIHVNAAVHYAIKAYEKPVLAVETGIMIDAFIKKVPIMVETDGFKNNSLFINVYFNILIGNRWN